jgi:protein-tyrosine phosphatase
MRGACENNSELGRVLFLCSGNYYRSRHAEIYFNWLAACKGAAWRAASRGLELSDSNLGFVSAHTAARVAALAIDWDFEQRPPAAVSKSDFSMAHHVVAVKGAEHRAMIARAYPEWLAQVEFWEIHDLDCAAPQVALPELEREVEGLLDRLLTRGAMSKKPTQVVIDHSAGGLADIAN